MSGDRNEEDITNKVEVKIERVNKDWDEEAILIYLWDTELSKRIGFFTPTRFYPMVGGYYRLVSEIKSIQPHDYTWFKVFRVRRPQNEGPEV